MRHLVVVTLASVLVAGPALAQPSLFDQKPMNEPASAPPAAGSAKPKPKPKPRGPVPARTLLISNAGTVTVASLEVAGDGKAARLAKPLPPNGKVTLKLPVLKTCAVTVTASFEGNPAADTTEHDICKDKTLRFTD